VNGFGSHAELRAVPARNAWPVPDGFDIGQAAVIPVAFGTAHDCLFEAGRLQPGETVLVQAGASGVGVAAIQLAKRAGATVLATASSDDRLERLKAFGLDQGINYAREDVPAAVKRLTDNKGADVVVDPVGGSTLQGSLDSLGYKGRVSLVGQAGREAVKVDVSALMHGNRALRGVFLGAEIMTDRAHDMIQTLIEEAARGELTGADRPHLPAVEAAAAHAVHREPSGRRASSADPLILDRPDGGTRWRLRRFRVFHRRTSRETRHEPDHHPPAR
jgi:NADPH2:quinone reductase